MVCGLKDSIYPRISDGHDVEGATATRMGTGAFKSVFRFQVGGENHAQT